MSTDHDVVPAHGDWSSLKQAFLQTDWSLTEAQRTPGGELHPYPARFIPALPQTALRLFTNSGFSGTLVDPFCGSGTSLYEARRAGWGAIGNDLNPIAILLSRVRNTSWQQGDDAQAERHANRLYRLIRTSDAAVVEGIDIPRVDHWFDEASQTALSAARAYLESVPPSDPWHDRIALAISSCVVKVSRQESDTRYAAVEKKLPKTSIAEIVSRAVLRVASWLKDNALDSTQAQIYEGDARSLDQVGTGSATCSVFSPPYPNAYEYWLYHKYRMYWLRRDPIAVREAELGARPHYCKKNGLTERDFLNQMSEVFGELQRVLVPNSPILVVIGDSTIAGKRIDNREIIEESARKAEIVLEERAEREILRSRSSFNSSLTRGRRNEHVVLLRRA